MGLALGEGLPVIDKLLGHGKVGTTARYAHLMLDAEKTSAARIGQDFGSFMLQEGGECMEGGGQVGDVVRSGHAGVSGSEPPPTDSVTPTTEA